MLALDLAHMPLSPLRLLLHPQRLRINTNNPHPALKQPLIDIRRPLERKVARTQHRRPVEAEDIARFHTPHEERQAEVVACSQEVGSCVQVRRDVVWFLGGEVRKFLEEGFGDAEG